MLLCCTNRKGGVGKTSVAGNLAHELGQTHRVVVIDGDPQASLTAWLIDGQEYDHELVDVLYERCEPRAAVVKLDSFYLMPTTSAGELRKYTETQAGAEPYAMSDLCAVLERTGFEIVIVDLAPGLAAFEQGAIAAMDRALLVLEPEYLSVDGLGGLLGDIENIIKKRRSVVRYDWLVANRTHAGFTRHKLYLQALRKQWADYRLFTIKQGAAVSESQTVHQPLALYAPRDKRALPGYRDLAQALRSEYGER